LDQYLGLLSLPVKSEVIPLFLWIHTVLGDRQRAAGWLVPELPQVLLWWPRHHPSAACPISLTAVRPPLAELVGQDAPPHLSPASYAEPSLKLGLAAGRGGMGSSVSGCCQGPVRAHQ